MKKTTIFLILCFMFIVSGCIEIDDADVASHNLSKDADNFKVYRRIVFYNGITDKYMVSFEGYCSVEFYSDKFVVTIKTEDGRYLKHYLGKADNVFPIVEQLDSRYVSDKRYKTTYKPTVMIPYIEIR